MPLVKAGRYFLKYKPAECEQDKGLFELRINQNLIKKRKKYRPLARNYIDEGTDSEKFAPLLAQHPYTKCVRILSLVLKFIDKVKQKRKKNLELQSPAVRKVVIENLLLEQRFVHD